MTTAQAFTCQRPVPVDHPAFAGHFPGQPILPGVCVLGEVLLAWHGAAAAAADVPGAAALPPLPSPLPLSSAKFLSPVAPGEVLTLVLEALPAAAPTQLRFSVHAGDRPVASGSFALGGAP